MNMATTFTIATAIPSICAAWDRWFYSKDRDVLEGTCIEPSWCSWGSIIPMGRCAPVLRYFQLKLPSWYWGVPYHRDSGEILYQRMLLKIDGRPWRVVGVPA
jgi:hypothetical protein